MNRRLPAPARLILPALLALALVAPVSAQSPTFTSVVVFGDSLSDAGNITHRVENLFGLRYPGHDFNYADGRFTNSTNTFPPSVRFEGVWHEQLTRRFLHAPLAINSLDGGVDYAFGGATTHNGVTQRTVISNTTPFGGGQISISIDNLGRQVGNYLAAHAADPAALYIVWGGGNDLFDDPSPANVAATAERVGGLVTRLAQAGARNFLVPNVPPLGEVPNYQTNPNLAATFNAASAAYRDELTTALDATSASLAQQGIDVHLYRLDVYGLFQTLTALPAYFGFSNTRDSAQFRLSENPDQFVFWDDLHPTSAAHYQLAAAAYRTLNGGDYHASSLFNLSARSRVETGENVLIGGFIVGGGSAKRIIIRALGPSLTAHGVPGALSNPALKIYNAQGEVIAANDNWRSTQESDIVASGLAPTDNRESAAILTVPPGAYTAIVSGVGGEMGVGLIEVYDLDTATAPTSRPINVSARARVLTGDNVLIGGFLISGTGPRKVMVRAIGPSLTAHGVPGALANPKLTLYNAQGQAIAVNDNWRDSQEAEIAASPHVPSNDLESAIITTLPPGGYTAIVSGVDQSTGVGLVEIYELD